MTKPDASEGTLELEFVPFLKGDDAVARAGRRSLLSPYKIALFAQDLIVANLSFWLAAWITGAGSFLVDDPIQAISLLVLSLVLLAFFPTYRLYSYHHIFLTRMHSIQLFKSFFWSILTVGTILFLYTYPNFLEGGAAIPLVFLSAIAVLLLSRFYWNYLLYLVKAIGLSFIALGVIGFIISDEKAMIVGQWHFMFIGFSMAVSMVLVSRLFAVHWVFNRWMRRRFRSQVAIIGSDEEAKSTTRHLVTLNAPFWVAGFVGSREIDCTELPVAKGLLGELKELPWIIEREKVDEIIVTDENLGKRTLIALLDYCTSAGLTVWFPPKLMPIIDMKLYIDSFCGLPMIRLCSQRNSWLFNKIKHGLDALIALPGVLILLPLFLVIAAAVKMNSRGPAFYRTKAVGKNGKIFNMYKFRSMVVNEDHEIHKDFVTKLIKGDICPESNGNKPLKVADDPRVTAIGRLLRRSSLDELPQLINVLGGYMSLVGPRPCLPYEYEAYQDWHKKRLSVRPGITGLWQVAGRSAVSFEDMVLLDLYYIYNRGLLMDMSIIYETLYAVLGKRGAY